MTRVYRVGFKKTRANKSCKKEGKSMTDSQATTIANNQILCRLCYDGTAVENETGKWKTKQMVM